MPRPVANVTLNSALPLLELFVAKHRYVIQMLISDTRAMGRVLDVVWYDLRVTFATGRAYILLHTENSDVETPRRQFRVKPLKRGGGFPTAKVYTPHSRCKTEGKNPTS